MTIQVTPGWWQQWHAAVKTQAMDPIGQVYSQNSTQTFQDTEELTDD